MDVILIPGLWLDARSWEGVVPHLERAGHSVRAFTPPGLGAPADATAEIGLDDWIAAAVAVVDAAEHPVVVVGHSGGGNVAWGVADARPDALSRVILVDTVPPAPGFAISEFPVVDGVVPFPGWESFPDEDVYDLDPSIRARTAPLTSSVPERVPTDPITLVDPARHRVPVTMLMGRFDRDALIAELAQWPPFGAEFAAIADAEVVTLGSGHWPQFSMPAPLAERILQAIDRGERSR